MGQGLTTRQLEALCGRWPGVTRDIKWGDALVFSVGGKMFVVTGMQPGQAGRLMFKVPVERFLELTDQAGMAPAPYLARAHWIAVTDRPRFDRAELEAHIQQSYLLVRSKLSKKQQAALGRAPFEDER
ncbi:MmcQ/YjbR family DNA-binding protein [Dyella sp.]|uniref:MmcQ/YjbR family DNA-binding protein n=1 Tax=Dyella sp. TaxID=1869338 RepID=UPI002ED33A18